MAKTLGLGRFLLEIPALILLVTAVPVTVVVTVKLTIFSVQFFN
jgi:hypothetical protein